ncbi:hypothetical protein [Terriglobus roseus]|uniref:Uncharacterized protein n=1 Tax=Terriglobus roseus TaxID=392734 RepID=A0A1H4N9P1_9BACT|nr:hypothetical protein [Terriglobus roseus]SEB92140.1 hypothetical protein SAMN05443244_2187 [Terriglobus roseus]
MEVHVPEHPIHTWREFFTHIGIVTIGLLIAIALEQSVEALHHRHQRTELREALHQDGERTIADTQRMLINQRARMVWLKARMTQVRTAIASHNPLPVAAAADFADFDLPDMPAWRAARASGLLERLPQDDLRAWSEVDLTLTGVNTSYADQMTAIRKRHAFETQFNVAAGQSTTPMPSDAMQRYFDLLSDEASTVLALQSDVAELQGAEEAVLHGERSLDHIQESERHGELPVNTDRRQ